MFRYPFGVFEWYKGLAAAHPWQMNWFYALSSMTVILTLGKGAEKIVCKKDDAPMRWVMPYAIKDYRWDFKN